MKVSWLPLLLVAAAISGCSVPAVQPETSAAPDADQPVPPPPLSPQPPAPEPFTLLGRPRCEAALQQEPGRDFVLAPPFDGPPERIALLAAQALGVELEAGTHEERPFGSGNVRHLWKASGGTLAVVTDYLGNNDWEIEFRADGTGYDRQAIPMEDAMVELLALFVRLDLPTDVRLALNPGQQGNVSELVFHQQLPDGQPVRISFGGMVRIGPEGIRALFLHPVYCFPAGSPAVGKGDAEALAIGAARDFLQDKGVPGIQHATTHADVRLRDDRLLYHVTVWDRDAGYGCGAEAGADVEVWLLANSGEVVEVGYAPVACPD